MVVSAFGVCDRLLGMIFEFRRLDSDLRVRPSMELRLEGRRAGVEGTPRSWGALRGTVDGSADRGQIDEEKQKAEPLRVFVREASFSSFSGPNILNKLDTKRGKQQIPNTCSNYQVDVHS